MVGAKYLLDSNILSEPLRPQPNTLLLERLEEHSAFLVTASVVWHELWFGAERLPHSKKRRLIEEFLMDYVGPTVPILAYDESAARWHGKIRAKLQSLGKTPPFRDGQIAAIARVNNLKVITANVSDFENFPEIEVLNWMEP